MKLSKMTGTIRGGNCEGAEVAQAKSSVDGGRLSGAAESACAGLRRLREENLAKDQVSAKTLRRSLCTFRPLSGRKQRTIRGLWSNCSTRGSLPHAFFRNISPLVIPFQSTEIVSPFVT